MINSGYCVIVTKVKPNEGTFLIALTVTLAFRYQVINLLWQIKSDWLQLASDFAIKEKETVVKWSIVDKYPFSQFSVKINSLTEK